MNHDITHCTGVKGDTVCEKCHWKAAHEDLLRLVRRGELEAGHINSYAKAEECVKLDHNMLWEHE